MSMEMAGFEKQMSISPSVVHHSYNQFTFTLLSPDANFRAPFNVTDASSCIFRFVKDAFWFL